MGQGSSCTCKFPLHKDEKYRDALQFFNVATEAELLERYPCLSDSLAKSIFQRRQKHPFRRLKEVYNFKCAFPLFSHECNSEPIVLIQERCSTVHQSPQRHLSQTCTSSQSPPAYGLIPSHIFPEAPSAPPFQLSELDTKCEELLELLRNMGLVDLWSKYTTVNSVASDEIEKEIEGYRLASWNLNRFSLAKARHPGFREAICLVILRNQIDLIAFQEVSDAEAITSLVAELNRPNLPMVRKWTTAVQKSRLRGNLWSAITSPQSTGKNFQSVEYSSFLFRHDRVQAISTSILGRTSNVPASSSSVPRSFARDPFIGKFRINGATLVLASVHLKATGLQSHSCGRTTDEVASLVHFVDAIEDTFASSVHYIILGDFNLNPGNEAFDPLRSRNLHNVIDSSVSTMLAAAEREGNNSSCYDNAWLSPNLITPTTFSSVSTQCSQLHFDTQQNARVIVAGLRHPLISTGDGASFNGSPSDHCPIVFHLASN